MSHDSEWADACDWTPVHVGAKEESPLVTASAPSAGVVTIKLAYDGSYLAPDAEQGRVVLRAWSSLNRVATNVPIEWEPSSQKTHSLEATIVLPLNDEYEAVKRKTSTYKLGDLRHDSNVIIEAYVEEASHAGNVAVGGRTGTSFLPVAKLVELSKQKSVAHTEPMYLFGQLDTRTNTNAIKGALEIRSVQFAAKDTATLHALHSQGKLLSKEPGPFEVAPVNFEFIGNMTGTVIGRTLYDVVNDENLVVTGTRPENTRIRMPTMQTDQPHGAVNQLPLHAFFLNSWKFNPLPSDAPGDEAYLLGVFETAFKHRNMSLDAAEKIMTAQLARTDAVYDPQMNECVANIARSFMLVSNIFPYQSDIRNMAMRSSKFMSAVPTGSAVLQVESLDYAQLRGGGDCEDLARYVYMHSRLLKRGTWKSTFLQTVQKVAGMYDTVMMLGSVTSPSLGNEHDVEKTAAHLRDAKTHHHTLKRSGAKTHLMRSNAVQTKHGHTVIGSKEDDEKQIGGHSWTEMHPKHKIAKLISRVVPQTSDAKVSPVAEESGPAWKFFLPSMVLEGTGRMNPLLMPAAYYATPGQNRDAIRHRSLNSMASFHELISKSPLFASLQSEAQPSSTVNTPGHRLTEFYVQATQMFTDEYLESTGAVAFNWVQLMPLSEAVESSSSFFALPPNEKTVPDPLFENADTLCRERIDVIQSRFVKSAAVKSNAKSPAAALSIDNHESELQALAVGAAVTGEMSNEYRMKTIDPSKYTSGVDLELRVADRPYAPNIALVPIGSMLPLEARVLASQMRQLTPDEQPSRSLSMFATGPNVEFVRQSNSNLDEADASAMARLVDHPKLVAEQRARVAGLQRAVTHTFIDRPWIEGGTTVHTVDGALELNLQTFFFRPHDLISDNAVPAVANELKRLRDANLIYTARFYVSEPTQNFKLAALQLLCVPPSDVHEDN